MRHNNQNPGGYNPTQPNNHGSGRGWNPYNIKDLNEHFQQVQISPAPATQKADEAQPSKLTVNSVPFFNNPMCFLDIEMTDTDPMRGEIAEIAVCLVSGDLRQQIMIANLVIKIELLNELKTDEVIKRFTKSGLWSDLQNPEKTVALKDAEDLILRQLQEYGITANQIPSAGIQAYNDRIILERQMPDLNKFLNFTIVDIASVDEIASRWNKRVFNKRDAKESRLRAGPNVYRAIQRMQYYKFNLFKGTGQEGGERNIFEALLPNPNYGIPLYQDQQNNNNPQPPQYGPNGIPGYYPGQQFWRGQD